MKPGKNIATVLVTGAMLFVLSACQKEGPAERAGKDADKAMQSVGKSIEKAGENIQDAAKGEKKRY